MKLSPYLLAMIMACWQTGRGAVQFVDPPSGQVIANFEGTENFTTIMCNVTASSGIQATTRWGIENYRNISALQNILDNSEPTLFLISGDLINGFNINNRLTLLRLIPELDGTILYCGTGALPQQANFPIRIYRPPNLRDNDMYRIEENSLNVPVDLSQAPAAFPEPRNFSWTKNGAILNDVSLTYSTISFPSVHRSHAGSYVVSATNFIFDNTITIQVGSDTGSFTLDVIYNPTFAEPGLLQHYALLETPLSLVCGTGLDSNPSAIITWTAPDATTITMDMDRYTLENGPDIVRLNFTRTRLSDTGTWRCDIRVISAQHVVSDRSLVPQNPSVIGKPITHDIQLTIIAIPSQPHTLSVDRIEATSVRICWEAPIAADSPITFYSIRARNMNATSGNILVQNTTTNMTFFTVTDLLPGTTYKLTVVALSQGGEIFAESQPSDPETVTTEVTVPAPTCDDPVSADGDITVTWSFIHKGGLPLTRVSVVYQFQEGLAMSPPTYVEIDNTEVMTATVPDLVAGRLYTFTITAENSNGSKSIDCGPVRHDIGIPAAPSFGELRSGSQAGQVVIQIKTIASGVSDPAAQGFEFVIHPFLDGTRGNGINFPRPNYQSNMFETITISDLMPGQSYIFIATAVNSFGESTPQNSAPVLAAGTRPPTQSPAPPGPPQSGSINAAIVGGAVGVLSMIIVIVITAIFLVLLLRKRKRTVGAKVEVPIYDEPDNFQWNTANASNIELKECPAYEKLQKGTHIQLEQCPAYGELKRNPSSC